MPYGWQGKILWVDVSTGKTWEEEPNEIFYRQYWGGGCIGGYFLLKELSPKIDPFHPENAARNPSKFYQLSFGPLP
ncbi:unnamed protein product [marine sediment metagenome]|uniref:Aldehyde ferredoxin oxidoreductase N-terminal domain-containing protein n=1 Tax=marine sediment metagenome TaxID=412755 RepID=X1LGY2_9ZZZZ